MKELQETHRADRRLPLAVVVYQLSELKVQGISCADTPEGERAHAGDVHGAHQQMMIAQRALVSVC